MAGKVDLVTIEKGCGYPNAVSSVNFEEIDKTLSAAKYRNNLHLSVVEGSIGVRADLGSPTTTALENKRNFMINQNKKMTINQVKI